MFGFLLDFAFLVNALGRVDAVTCVLVENNTFLVEVVFLVDEVDFVVVAVVVGGLVVGGFSQHIPLHCEHFCSEKQKAIVNRNHYS